MVVKIYHGITSLIRHLKLNHECWYKRYMDGHGPRQPRGKYIRQTSIQTGKGRSRKTPKKTVVQLYDTGHLKGNNSLVDQPKLQNYSAGSRSQIWNFFVQNGDDKTTAMCLNCRRVIARYGTSTSNMICHLRNNHFELNQEFYRLTFGHRTKTGVGVGGQRGSTASVGNPEPITLAIEDPEGSRSSSPELCANPPKQRTPITISEPADIPNKLPASWSKIWSFFTSSSRSLYYRCNECGRELKQYRTVTSNFISHLRLYHVDLHRQYRHLTMLANQCPGKEILEKRVTPRGRSRPRKNRSLQQTKMMLSKIESSNRPSPNFEQWHERQPVLDVGEAIHANVNLKIEVADLQCVVNDGLGSMEEDHSNPISSSKLSRKLSPKMIDAITAVIGGHQSVEMASMKFGVSLGALNLQLYGRCSVLSYPVGVNLKTTIHTPPTNTQPISNSDKESGQARNSSHFGPSSGSKTATIENYSDHQHASTSSVKSSERYNQQLTRRNPRSVRVQRGRRGDRPSRIPPEVVEINPAIELTNPISHLEFSRKLSTEMIETINASRHQNVEVGSMSKYGVSKSTLNLELHSRSSILVDNVVTELDNVDVVIAPPQPNFARTYFLEDTDTTIAEKSEPVDLFAVPFDDDQKCTVLLSPCAPPPGNASSVADLICVKDCPDEQGSCDVTFEEKISDKISEYLEIDGVEKLCNYFNELVEVDIKITTELGLSIVGSVLLEKGFNQIQIDSMLTNEWWQLFCFKNSIVSF